MEQKKKKSKRSAITSFVFGLTFWIPLLNLIFSFFAVYFGITSLKNIKKEPLKYGGKSFAIIGLILGSLVHILYIIGLTMCLSGSQSTCNNLGLAFLSNP